MAAENGGVPDVSGESSPPRSDDMLEGGFSDDMFEDAEARRRPSPCGAPPCRHCTCTAERRQLSPYGAPICLGFGYLAGRVWCCTLEKVGGYGSSIASSCTCKTHAMYSTMCIGTWEGMGIAARRVQHHTLPAKYPKPRREGVRG